MEKMTLKKRLISGELIPAVIQDKSTGEVLMLAYVNWESFEVMQKEGVTCFWSRSRNELWRKGQTSGNVQVIETIQADCDEDTLLIRVEQIGNGACCRGTKTCFGENLYKRPD